MTRIRIPGVIIESIAIWARLSVLFNRCESNPKEIGEAYPKRCGTLKSIPDPSWKDVETFTEEELKSLQELQGTYNQITLAFGQLSLSRLGLDGQEEQLKTTLADTRTKENELAKLLTEKYGKGSLNIDTGEFTPETTPEVAEKAE